MSTAPEDTPPRVVLEPVGSASAYSRGYYAGAKRATAVIAENRHLRHELKRLRAGVAQVAPPDEQEHAIEYLLKTSSTLAAAAKLLIEARTNQRPNNERTTTD